MNKAWKEGRGVVNIRREGGNEGKVRRRGLRRHGKDSGEQQRSRGKRRRTKLGLDERGWGRVRG